MIFKFFNFKMHFIITHPSFDQIQKQISQTEEETDFYSQSALKCSNFSFLPRDNRPKYF